MARRRKSQVEKGKNSSFLHPWLHLALDRRPPTG